LSLYDGRTTSADALLWTWSVREYGLGWIGAGSRAGSYLTFVFTSGAANEASLAGFEARVGASASPSLSNCAYNGRWMNAGNGYTTFAVWPYYSWRMNCNWTLYTSISSSVAEARFAFLNLADSDVLRVYDGESAAR
jgi:hypothetical protein